MSCQWKAWYLVLSFWFGQWVAGSLGVLLLVHPLVVYFRGGGPLSKHWTSPWLVCLLVSMLSVLCCRWPESWIILMALGMRFQATCWSTFSFEMSSF